MATRKPMIVVAKEVGYYGNKIRAVGERFAISKPDHFSKRWMLDPKKDDTRSVEAQYSVPERKRDITDEQMLAELADSAGAVAALRKENAMLKEQIRTLKGEADARKEASHPEVGPEEAGEEAAAPAGEGDDEAGETEGGAENGRKTRRRH